MEKENLYRKVDIVNLFNSSESDNLVINSLVENYLSTRHDIEISRRYSLFLIFVWHDFTSAKTILSDLWFEKRDLWSMIYLIVFQDVYEYIDYNKFSKELICIVSKDNNFFDKAMLNYTLGLTQIREYSDSGNVESLELAIASFKKTIQLNPKFIRAYDELIGIYRGRDKQVSTRYFNQCVEVLNKEKELFVESVCFSQLESYYQEEHILGTSYYYQRSELLAKP